MSATKNGITNCPNCKAIDEKILEEAFLEAFRLLAENFDDVLDSVLNTIEEVFKDDKDYQKKKQLDKDISAVESKKSRMTDMLIDGTISKEVYDDKIMEFTRKLHTLVDRRNLLNINIDNQKNVSKRMAELRRALENKNILDVFDRVVFDSIIEKVIVGGFSENGKADPYKLTFVMKGNETGIIPDAKMHFKEIKKVEKKGKRVS